MNTMKTHKCQKQPTQASHSTTHNKKFIIKYTKLNKKIKTCMDENSSKSKLTHKMYFLQLSKSC